MNALLGRRIAAAAFAAAAALTLASANLSRAAAPALPGLSEPLGAGPFIYRTGEGHNIKVTVMARLPWPYALTFLPNGDLLISTGTGQIKRIAKGTSTLIDVPGGPQAVGTEAGNSVHGYMGIAVHPKFAQNHLIYMTYTKGKPKDPKSKD